MNSAHRASDEDRQRVVASLERHTAAGRLTLDEFSERVGRVFAAATLSDLAGTVSDLPPEPAAGPVDAGSRQLAVAFLLAIGVLVILAVVLAIWR